MKAKPDYYEPKYANYIWKEHAPNVIKLIFAMKGGTLDDIAAATDGSIQDLKGTISQQLL